MSLKRANILVIDDDIDVLTAVRLLLRPEVKEVVIEKNPEQIPQHLAQTNFDLVLLDMNFNASINTGNEGIYWLKRIKEIKPAISVIMITAYDTIADKTNAINNGADFFIAKPFTRESILNLLEDVLN